MNAELGDQRVDRADLNARSPASVAQRCRGEVIFAVRLEQWKCRESHHNLRGRFGTRETLEQLLKNEPGGHDDIGSQQGVLQRLDLRLRRRNIATHGE